MFSCRSLWGLFLVSCGIAIGFTGSLIVVPFHPKTSMASSSAEMECCKDRQNSASSAHLGLSSFIAQEPLCCEAMRARDAGDCDRAVSRFRESLRVVEQEPKPREVADADWASLKHWAPVIYDTAVAEAYLKNSRYKDALEEYSRLRARLTEYKDLCCSQGCEVKLGFVSKVNVPMSEAKCCIGMGDYGTALEKLLSVSRYMPGGDLRSGLCPQCASFVDSSLALRVHDMISDCQQALAHEDGRKGSSEVSHADLPPRAELRGVQ